MSPQCQILDEIQWEGALHKPMGPIAACDIAIYCRRASKSSWHPRFIGFYALWLCMGTEPNWQPGKCS